MIAVLHKAAGRNITSSILLLVVVGCTAVRQRGLVDENLLIKLPIPGSGWTIHSGERGRDSMTSWSREGEWFKLTITHGRGSPEPRRARLGIDDAARENLTLNLQSVELKQGSVNNYPMILWQTSATLRDGTKTFNLFLYIKGNDAAYFIQRRWNYGQVPEEEQKLWIDYMSSISVVDNRYPEHQSAKMEEAWPGLYYESKATNDVSH
jgi:hypothetical protein